MSPTSPRSSNEDASAGRRIVVWNLLPIFRDHRTLAPTEQAAQLPTELFRLVGPEMKMILST